MTSKNIGFLKMYKDSLEPEIGSKLAAGIDLKAYEDYILEPNTITKIKTGLKFKFPPGYFGKIEDRSSISLKDLKTVAGIIDRDYTGEIIVLLKNNNNHIYKINRGEKIAQIICVKYLEPILEEITQLEETERADKGFGSTGK